ncbi:MAG: CAP domain-containing protein [Angelakisella sp.]|jgi:uncharacterized protein YkwD|nr:CAP domain-containing protein [Angelakisella sp.]
MKITKKLLLPLLAALCLGLSACAPKAMEAFAAWQPEISLYAGDSWEGEIPGDSDAADYTISVNNVPGLEARLEGNLLILHATRAGDGQITLSATAKGFHDTNLTIPIQIHPRTLELDWETTYEIPAEGEKEYFWEEEGALALLVGKSFHLSFLDKYEFAPVLEETSFSARLEPEDLGTLQMGEAGELDFTAGEKYGQGTLEITAAAPNYEDAVFSIPLTVVRGKLPLTITENGTEIDAIDMENGTTCVIKVVAGGGEIDAQLDCPDAKMTRNGSAYAITAATPAEGTLTVSATGEGWLGTTVKLPVVVTKTKAVVTPAAASVDVEPGSQTTVALTTKPQGAQVTATVTGEGFTAAVEGSTLTIAAAENAEGTAEVTLSVIAPGYADGTAKVTAAARLEPITLGLSAASVTMEEGEKKTVTLTAAPEGCQFTAEATGGVTAEIDGNKLILTGKKAGSGSVSVTASLDGRDPVTKTVTATITQPIVLPNVDTTTYADEAAEIIRLTNQYRKENGLGTLSHVSIVDIPATVRAEEAAAVWSHTRPDGSNFNTVFTQCGLKYTAYGENLFAVNAWYTPEEVLQEWKDSPAHNENLLRENFNGIGVGIAYIDGEYYYCQLFIQK